MKFVLPRVILGNRGDLTSRWGVLRALHQLGMENVTVFCRDPLDVPSPTYRSLPYRPLKNLLLDPPSLRALIGADAALWTVGLDMQDDSSLTKLLYLWVTFRLYRLLGLRVWVLFQGAGPLTTPPGRRIAREVLKQVDTFVARDPGTYDLVGKIHPAVKRVLAYDGIFLPGFEQDAARLDADEKEYLETLFDSGGRPVVGLNVRQWFHFASSLIPYQLSKKAYRQRSQPKMERLIASTVQLVRLLRKEQDARLLLISAYQPGVVPWEDDLPWLAQVEAAFADSPEVLLTDFPLGLPAYYAMMSRLSLMIGMRLHSSLIALRFGVPAINLSYTLKGGDIFGHLGLAENVFALQDFLESPQKVYARAAALLAGQGREVERVRQIVGRAVETNMDTLRLLLSFQGTRP